MADLEVLEFKKTEDAEVTKARMPTAADIETLLRGTEMRGAILIVINEDDYVGYYRTNLTDHEAVGILEETKLMLLNAFDHDEYELED